VRALGRRSRGETCHAPHFALQLPEIRLAICQQLANDGSAAGRAALACIACPNHDWSANALDMLWCCPRADTLPSMAVPDRRCFYAAKICALHDATGGVVKGTTLFTNGTTQNVAVCTRNHAQPGWYL
jgi:hypothetical protein